ncbi:class I SAM-dependent methyltransferase [Bradyrhizobium sp. 76]|uniref:class I SAM-dependent methyltransferase n=1 Tax=Bradyrhizobium sp. 76 TaxID=2782680 RepID=UPI001FF942BF|nr:class I SAM-dependent methyltransferase [Bradyrhizobium sp. 76]MCK1406660.1 class I SAM-dependent methyltransferase [Bradyrhizobium sp. 76]
MPLLDEGYKQLYSDYYQPNSALEHKRNLSADSTVEHIKAVAQGRKWKNLLDVGAGNGSVLAKIGALGLADELYAVEISESGVSTIREHGLPTLKEARVFDGYTIPYPDKFFDLAISIHVLEHVEHERIFLRELARVAKEIVIEVPLEGGLTLAKSIKQTARFGHINHYTVPGFRYLLRTVGIEPVEHMVTTSSADYERHLYGGFKGTIKSAVRRGALKIAPNIAPWVLSYLLTIRCIPSPPPK